MRFRKDVCAFNAKNNQAGMLSSTSQMACRPTIGNELVQVFSDLLADNIWPAIPVERVAEKGKHDFLRQGGQSLKG